MRILSSIALYLTTSCTVQHTLGSQFPVSSKCSNFKPQDTIMVTTFGMELVSKMSRYNVWVGGGVARNTHQVL